MIPLLLVCVWWASPFLMM
ncbi:hypothetical protein ACHAXA_008627 [Cyclostephanos tholiformis]|uniref:Uncharacterized protein n=1 Tax=Cyclostephanos tholiformis TaxID=382380 RepID=A0ABD3R500_9STRA